VATEVGDLARKTEAHVAAPLVDRALVGIATIPMARIPSCVSWGNPVRPVLQSRVDDLQKSLLEGGVFGPCAMYGTYLSVLLSKGKQPDQVWRSE